MFTIPDCCSVHDADLDHEFAKTLIIALDGVVQSGVVAYNLSAGMIIRHVLDANGNAQIEPNTDHVWTETVEGNVEVTRTPPPASKV